MDPLLRRPLENATLNAVCPGRGPSIVTEIEWKLDENILLKSKLNLFAPIRTFDHVIVRSENSLSAKVNQVISVNLELSLINERDVSPRTQIKQSISIGLNYAIG